LRHAVECLQVLVHGGDILGDALPHCRVKLRRSRAVGIQAEIFKHGLPGSGVAKDIDQRFKGLPEGIDNVLSQI
jgi:hypothetical protein